MTVLPGSGSGMVGCCGKCGEDLLRHTASVRAHETSIHEPSHPQFHAPPHVMGLLPAAADDVRALEHEQLAFKHSYTPIPALQLCFQVGVQGDRTTRGRQPLMLCSLLPLSLCRIAS
jgi:hypothetical protein